MAIPLARKLYPFRQSSFGFPRQLGDNISLKLSQCNDKPGVHVNRSVTNKSQQVCAPNSHNSIFWTKREQDEL